MSLGVELCPVCKSSVPQPQCWFPWKACTLQGFTCPFGFHFCLQLDFIVSDSPLLLLFFFFVSFKPIALPKASVPLSVLTSPAGTCLNHQCPGIFSSSPDSTFESYSFPSWVSFRRNLYLSFSPCPYLWLLCPLGLMENFDLKVSTGRHLFLL